MSDINRYKVWNETSGEWVCEHKRKQHEPFIYLSQDGRLWWKYPSSMEEAWDCRVVKSTGLKDKNGALIFEGDILRGSTYPYISDELENYLASVHWCDDTACFFDDIHPISDRVSGRACGGSIFSDELTSCFEIIGNIYENPELIK